MLQRKERKIVIEVPIMLPLQRERKRQMKKDKLIRKYFGNKCKGTVSITNEMTSFF